MKNTFSPPQFQAPEPPELVLQSHCFQWAWNMYPGNRRMMFHVQNKAKNRREGNKFKAIGVVKGISDLVVLCPHGRVMWCEMKTRSGTQSKEQIDFQQKVQNWGYCYVVIRTEEEFRQLIQQVWGAPQWMPPVSSPQNSAI